jgi:hypothetical protein
MATFSHCRLRQRSLVVASRNKRPRPATLSYSSRCLNARLGAPKQTEGSAMTDETEKRDMRDWRRTDESSAAEKKVGESPLDRETTRPQDPPPGPQESANTQ